ncbi:MAG: PAS domain S-box protein [Candidatus Tectimicrobiota bacterium]
MRFAVLDDHPDDCVRIAQVLAAAFPAAECQIIRQRQEFEAMLAQGGCAALLTEAQLTWSDGLSVLREVHARFPHLPVLMLTAAGSELLAVEGLQAGLSDYLPKAALQRLPEALRHSLKRAAEAVTRQQYEEELQARALQQEAVAELGLRALGAGEPQALLHEAVELAAQVLGVEYAHILELLPDGRALLLRAGVGWHSGFVGQATIEADRGNQVGYTLGSEAPVLVADLSTETRFHGPQTLFAHGVVSSMSVVIRRTPQPLGVLGVSTERRRRPRPFGVLGIYSTRRRSFSKDDMYFLQAVANVLAQAMERRRAEDALQRSEARLRQIIDLVPVYIYARNQHGQFILANRATAEAYGSTPDGLEGKTLLDVTPYASEVQAALRDDHDVLHSGVTRYIPEEHVTDAAGHTHILQTTKMPFIAAGTREAAVLGISVDISQRKHTEETLAAEARFLRTQTAMAHIALSSLQADVLIPQLLESICKAQDYAYGFFWRLVDDARTAVIVASFGRETSAFIGFREPLLTTKALVAETLRTGQPLFRNRLAEGGVTEHPLTRAFGGKALLGLPLINRAGEVMGALTFGDAKNPERFSERDLQQGLILMHQVAQALENSELFSQVQRLQEQYRVVTEHLHDAVYMLDREGTIVFANPALARLTGYDLSALLGCSGLMLYAPEVLPQLVHRRDQVWQGQEASPYLQTRLLRRDGQRLAVEMSMAALTVDGQSVGLVVVARDMTSRLQLEAQLRQAQKMQAVGTLAGGIAHDFNNILTAILGYTELTLDEVPPATTAWRNLQRVLTASERARDLVRQILTFSRHTEQERQPVHLHLLVQEALLLLRAALPTTITLEQQLDEHAGAVLADPTQMHQIVMNLCTNAEYAMRATGGILRVQLDAVDLPSAVAMAHPELGPGRYARLQVLDTGHGMEPEVLERIFEPFFTTKDVGEGSGLGLAVVHGIVTSHHGAILAESTPGAGTRFTVYLPQSRVTTMRPVEEQARVVTGQERILFVDDEELLTHLAETQLTRLGYTVLPCTSSLEALALFQQAPHDFDLVITDQTMPQMTGEVLARALRAVRADVPIILCTGFSHIMTPEKAQELGLDAFCMKPLKLHELGMLIRHVLAQRAAKKS